MARRPWNKRSNESMTLGPPSGPLTRYSQIAQPLTFVQSPHVKMTLNLGELDVFSMLLQIETGQLHI